MEEGANDFHERAIEQIKTLGEIISCFLNEISDSPACEADGTSIDEIADRLAIDIYTPTHCQDRKLCFLR